ncbi:hypothetical protein [Micromonospora sp. WMMA1947]|uniref:hypothetical protein n=1 Tax=Micromonospora sp. WMMA1947 TaxID=3015163 RepID=UPI00248C1F6E|nr:hypothetical protein [Micromonospora sp. WMMA1947]WBC11285.1 hypothetical protein O7604_10620 [Micromonospora sp. WMMA1947]
MSAPAGSRRALHGGQMKIRSVLAAGVLAAVLLAFGSPAPAQAADVLQVNSAYNDSSDDLGRLYVSVTSSQPVAEIRAELVDEETGALVARATDFVLHSEAPEKTVFRTSAPLILDALGDYLVHVAVTDVAGNHVRQERAGWILYRVVTFLEDVTINPTTVDYDNRQVAVRGVLKGRWPGTGEVRPLADFPVQVNSSFDPTPAITASDGSFGKTVTIYAISPEVDISYSYSLGRPYFEYIPQQIFPITIDPRETRITAKVNRTRVAAGQSVRLTGQLSWLTASGWAPHANQVHDIYLDLCDDNRCYATYGPLDTDGKGQFAADVVPLHSGYFIIGYSPSDRFVAGSSGRTKAVTVVAAQR